MIMYCFKIPLAFRVHPLKKFKFRPTDGNAPFALFVLSMSFPFSNLFGSTSAMAVYTWAPASLRPYIHLILKHITR